MQISNNLPISLRTLDELLGNSLTSSVCVNSHRNTKIWVLTGMLAHHLESFTDSVVVRDSIEKEKTFGDHPIGIVGGKEIIENVLLNPHSNFFERAHAEDVMYQKWPVVTKQSKLFELLDNWRSTKRAFAIIPNELNDYSPISTRRVLEIGMKVKTDMTISELPKKRLVTFKKDDKIGDIMNLMLKNKTRKLILEGSASFISDRIIVEKIAEDLKFLRDVENFLLLPIKNFRLENVKEVQENLSLPEASKLLYEMEHPYLMCKDHMLSPFDVCMALASEELTEYDLYK